MNESKIKSRNVVLQAVGKWMEQLEGRQLLTAQISYANFSSTAGLTLNGYGSSATTSGTSLVLTDALGEARSALSATKVPTNTFTSHFTYQADAGSNQADGFAFVIDNGSPTDLGGDGQYFGYSQGTFSANSVAIAFDLYNQGAGGTYFGEGQSGAVLNETTNASPLDLHNGDKYDFTVTYNGTNLTVTGVDELNPANTFTNSTAINLPSVLGGSSAYVGFTGATGFETSNQSVSEFDFSGNSGPTVTTAATSSPSPITGTKAHLTVAATSNDGGTLSYTWSLLHKPSGATSPTFETNGTTSPTTTAHFFKDGTYDFLVTITDSLGGSTTSVAHVVVEQTPTAVKLMPHKQQITVKTTQQFTGSITDQFGRALRIQPTLTYAVQQGLGSINAATGLYSAGATAGHLVISVSGDDLSGTAGATVLT